MSADDLLVRLIEAEEAIQPDRDTFSAIEGGFSAGPPTVEVHHAGLTDPLEAFPGDLSDLVDAGWLRIESEGKAIVRYALTTNGRVHANAVRMSRSGVAAGSVSEVHPLDWEAQVLPVLQAVSRAYQQGMTPFGVERPAIVGELGLDEDEAGQFRAGLVIQELVKNGYLEVTLPSDAHIIPTAVRLTERGLHVTAGWPSSTGDVAFDRLLLLIEQRIEAASTDEERTKWEQFRDGAAGVGRDVLTGVLTTAANAAAKGLAS